MKTKAKKSPVAAEDNAILRSRINKVAIRIAFFVFIGIAGTGPLWGEMDQKLILDEGFESSLTNEWKPFYANTYEPTSNEAYQGTNSLHVVTKDGHSLAGMQKSLPLDAGIYSVEAMVKGSGSVMLRYSVEDVAVSGNTVQLTDKWQKITGKIYVFNGASCTLNIGAAGTEMADFYMDNVRLRRVGDLQGELDTKTDLALNNPYKLSFKPWPLPDAGGAEKFGE
jgi:hypothetical protein